MTERVTIGKHGGHLWIIKKGGKEISYALTEAEAKKKQMWIRDGTFDMTVSERERFYRREMYGVPIRRK